MTDMSDTFYGYPQSNDSDTVSLVLEDGTLFTVINSYSKGQSKAVVALIVASCISLVATVGLLAAIAMSAFNTRTIKSPNMFVRTHVAFYFVSLLLSDILQSISSIINSVWVHEGAVVYGQLCTAQGVLVQMSDVGIALWTLVIATRTFSVLFLRLDTKHYEKWIVLIAQWSLIGAFVIGGPATARSDRHGPFYGIVGDWCWIAANYTVHRILLDFMVELISAILAFILYSFVFLKLRGIVRERASSTTTTPADKERTLKENYEHRLARQMLLFPIAYTIMIVPLTLCRVLAWAGHDVPFGFSVFSDITYLLGGLVHVILFACTGRILPRNSVLPQFSISRPKTLLSSTAVASSDFDLYYGEAVTTGRNPKRDVERNDAFLSSITETADPRNPFADPVLPPINESIISDFFPADYYIDTSFLPEPSSPLDKTYPEQVTAVQMRSKR
ncbi:hypothetical protein V8E52_010605 [Russula decolorans]